MTDEIETIRARYAANDRSQAVDDCATLLAHVDRLAAELAEIKEAAQDCEMERRYHD
jgi:hypothetical protein